MATNRKATGKSVPIISASGAISSGALVAQEGFVGICPDTLASGAPGVLYITGIWEIPVPASTVKGDYLYIPGANGAVTESNAPTLTRTGSNTNTPVCMAVTDRDSNGRAQVLLLAQGARKAATQA